MDKETTAGLDAVAGQVERPVGQHTPGPWEFALFEHEPNEAFVQWQAGFAAVHGSRSRREANARLIAAAPELFDVVQALLLTQQMRMDPRDVLDENSPIMGAARDALRKVFGAA